VRHSKHLRADAVALRDPKVKPQAGRHCHGDRLPPRLREKEKHLATAIANPG